MCDNDKITTIMFVLFFIFMIGVAIGVYGERNEIRINCLEANLGKETCNNLLKP
jgi:preprotein translocase subunit SecG